MPTLKETVSSYELLEELDVEIDNTYLFTNNGNDFYAFMSIYLQEFNIDSINALLKELHEQYTDTPRFAKNLQCLIMVPCDDRETFKKEHGLQIIDIEDDEYYANKFVVPFDEEIQVIQEIEKICPIFYKDSPPNGEILSLEQLEESVIGVNPTFYKFLMDYEIGQIQDMQISEIINEIQDFDAEIVKEAKDVNVEQDNENTNKEPEFRYLKSITLNNFRNAQYVEYEGDNEFTKGVVYELEAESGVTTLSGPNGLGKTTFFHAVERLLYGSIGLDSHKRGEKPNDIYSNIHTQDSPYYVKVEFHSNKGKKIVSVREVESKASPSELKIQEEGRGTREGVNTDYLSSFFNLGKSEFRHFMYLPQNEYLNFVVQKTKGDRLKTLSPLIGVEKFRDLINKIGDSGRNSFIKDIEGKIGNEKKLLNEDLSKDGINEVEWKDIEKYSEFISYLSDDFHEITTNDIKEENANGLLMKLKKIHENYEHREIIRKKKISSNYNRRWSEWDMNKDISELQINAILSVYSTIALIKERVKDLYENKIQLDGKLEVISKIESKNDDITYFRKFENIIDRDFLDLLEKFCEESRLIKSQSDEIVKLEANIEALALYVEENNETFCPSCGTEFDESNDLLDSIRKSLTKIKERISSSNKDKLYKELLAHSFFEKSSSIEKMVEELDKEIKNLSWIKENFQFVLDLAKQEYKKIRIVFDGIPEESEEYINIEKIDKEFNAYNSIDIHLLSELIEFISGFMTYKAFLQNNAKGKEVKELEDIKESVKDYKESISKIIGTYEKNIVKSLSASIEKHVGSIIKYQQIGEISLETSNNGVQLKAGNSIPDYTFSQGQLSAVALGCLLSFYAEFIANKSTLRCLFIDDPIQTIDDLNSLNLINILRYEFSDIQIVISTHERDFDTLLRYKFKALGYSQKLIDMKNINRVVVE